MASRTARDSSAPIAIGSQPAQSRRTVSSSLPLARAVSRGSAPDKLAPPSPARRRSSARDRRPSQNLVRATESELTAKSLGDDDIVFEDLEVDAMSEGPAPRRSGKLKGIEELYECEKCGKSYKHPACLTKHRWQHTEYWGSTTQLSVSKHQQVQMLEAAAILLHGPNSLPAERALWPAAVSPPTSGLFGSDQLNLQTLRRLNAENVVAASPPMQAFAQLALEHSRIPTASTSKQQTDDDDAMELDGDLELDADEIFEFEHAPRGRQDVQSGSTGIRNSSTPSTAATTQRSDGSGSGAEDEIRKHLRVNPATAVRGAHQPANAYGVSAPTLGFFTARPLSTSITTDVEMS